MDAIDKVKKSAEALGVLLEIPAFVDPQKGFTNEKEVQWENGDSIKFIVDWADGAFIYGAVLGQVDPKTNQLSFITGPIASAVSLESLVTQVDAYLNGIAPLRVMVPADPVAVEPIQDEPAEVPAIDVPADVPVDSVLDVPAEVPAEPAEGETDVVADYQTAMDEYEQLLLDPDHDKRSVWECSDKLKGLEIKLREQGIKPYEIV